MKHKAKGNGSFFDEQFRLEKLNQQNDPLQKLNERIGWELFRPLLNEVFSKDAKGPGGCRPYDYVLMFKILILQRYYNISDDKMEYAILDRLSFMRFLGLTLSDKVPDAKTIWLFRERLTKSGAIEKLFVLFNEYLNREGLVANQGKMVDASFVEVPIQRNTRQENKDIKEGKVPEQWQENPHKLVQKDTDACWTKKNGRNYYGYKNHIKADEKSKLIDAYTVSDASVHDSQETEPLLSEADNGQPLHADSAYSGEPVYRVVEQTKMINQIHEKGYKNNPLTEEQKQSNRVKSKTRARI